MDLLQRTLEVLDWPFVLDALASHARTHAGRDCVQGLELSRDRREILESFDAIDELLALEERRAGSPPLAGIEPIDDALACAARGEVLDLVEVRSVATTLAALAELRSFVRTHAAAAPTLARLGLPIQPDAGLCRIFGAALDEHGRLSEVAYPLLGELRRRIASLERSIHQTLESLLDSAEYAGVLQDRYVTVRGDRFVVPVKSQARNLGLGIVHDASRSERTVFIEPAAIVPIGNQRRMAEAELKDEERRILGELSALAGTHAGALSEALAAAVVVDVAGARAAFAMRLRAERPVVEAGGTIALRGARHPVLALGASDVVANDLRLDAKRPVLVLTGPNAGGKTVAMKTIGLCALLVRAGCFVPAAPGTRVDLFDPILADIGDMQTVHEGLSSFSAHLTTLREMLARSGPSSLLLLDEIAAGTDPAQGGALARAVIERLADVGARVVATTHYTQVKRMSSDDGRVEVAALEYRDGRPTYHVVPGSIGESHALAAARIVGIDPVLVERARSLMDAGERALADTMAALEAEKQRAFDAAEQAESVRRELAGREAALSRREDEIAGRARELERRAASRLVTALQSAEQDVRSAVAALREDASRERADKARAAIAGARQAVENARRDERTAPREACKGDRVRLVGLGLAGEVTDVRGEEIEVRAGAMTVRARRSDVEVLTGGARTQPPLRFRSSPDPAPQPPAEPRHWLETALRVPGNTLDLRGVRVEEGIARLESFLDESMLENRDIVFVLHGHGSGAMKSAVRRVLAASPYVAASSPAPEDQGGDALTVSRLRD